eukprot:CAMPEP_0119011304 /NCGR_PEP_ID=MMETSP1176-20130426/5585_1 /TAXON_ID=265551 /ORGANISM="Synedropsis recta cf, Strain CCMP1620" /LENGTH=534 /DNA_ID=CAMNT_0006964105 /DNA_START=28 /DNA_END=1632 /DNA_ORIENTATION=+
MSSPYYASQGDGPVVVQGHVVGGVPVNSNYNNYSSGQQQQVVAAPINTNNGAFKGEAQPKRCNDAFFGILFYAHLGVMAWAAATYAPQMYEVIADEYTSGGDDRRSMMMQSSSSSSSYYMPRFLQEENNDGDGGEVEALAMNEVFLILGISGAVGFVISTLALSFMMTFARALIKVALWFNIIMSGLMALMALISGVIPLALMCLLGFAFSAYYAYVVWNRIPFAAANMVTAITAVRANLGVSFFAYLSLFLTFGWTLWWSFAFVATNFVANGCDAEGVCEREPNGGVVFLFLISYFWTMQVVKNVTHVTVAGTVGTWWFAPDEASSCCSKAVGQSWIRAMTYSFGSICFGSLIVAIIQAVKEVVHQMRDQNDSMLACCAECILGCIERLVEYFNQWAFVFVGLYGYSFMEAGKNVMTLFKSRGWTAIIADMLVDSVLSMVAIVVGLLTGVIGILAAQASGIDLSQGKVAAPFFLGFLFGFALAATLFSVVSSAVNTVIVCYAEAPAEFQQNHPKLSEEMRAAWKQAWPNDFSY